MLLNLRVPEKFDHCREQEGRREERKKGEREKRREGGKDRNRQRDREGVGGVLPKGRHLMGLVLSAVFRLSMVLLLSSSSSFSKASRDFLYKRKQKLCLHYYVVIIVNNLYKENQPVRT